MVGKTATAKPEYDLIKGFRKLVLTVFIALP